MFPHTVTLYILTEDPATFEPTANITVLRGVLLDATKAVNVRAGGLEGADAVKLYIPFDVKAADGVSLMDKRYVGVREYEQANDRAGLWTLDTGKINHSASFFVKGEVVEPGRDFQYINLNYDGVYQITKVDTKDFGNLQHWEVGGN